MNAAGDGVSGDFDQSVAVTTGAGVEHPETVLQLTAKSLMGMAKKEDVNIGGSGFVDGHNTSDWAKAAMEWAVHVGLLSGKDGGRLDPTGTASRAEIAQILMAFCNKVAQ